MWTVDDWVVPPNGAAQMLDCYPLPGGGVRAWGRWSEQPNSGIGAGEHPIGYHVRGGIPLRDGSNTNNSDFYLVTRSGTNPKLYRLDMTEVPSPNSWTLLKDFAAGAGGGLADFTVFKLTTDTGVPALYLMVDYVGSDTGIWKIVYADGTVSRPAFVSARDLKFALPLSVHQNRLIVNDSQGASKVWFTDPGAETMSDTYFHDLENARNLTGNTWFHPFAPDDLLVAKDGAPFVFIQGDISDTANTIIRAMGDVRHSAAKQVPAELDDGIAFQAYNDGVYATPDGAQFHKLSEQLSAGDLFTFTSNNLGQLAFMDNWMLTPNGFIYDVRTKAWFQTSRWSKDLPAKHIIADKEVDEHRFHAAQDPADAGSLPRLFSLKSLESGMDRATEYTLQMAPLHNPDGRQVEIGTVQVVCKSYTGGASVDCTVNGVTRTISGISSGRTIVPFLFRERGDVLDITLTMRSNSATIEAPSIEEVRFGVLEGHLLPYEVAL